MPPRLRSAVDPNVTISLDEARSIALRAQGLVTATSAPKTAAEVLRRTGAVQLDTIAVLARSHELVPYARIGAVPRERVERTYWGAPAQAFEYYAHANCILPVESWPYFAFRRRALAQRWPNVRNRTLDEVRARLAEGPVTASDVGGARSTAGWWNWSDAKRGLEMLYRLGEAVVTTRRGWKRVYDLPERAIRADLLRHEPSDEECYRYLVGRAASALGVGTRQDIANYFLLTRNYAAGAPASARRLLDDAIEAAGLMPVAVEGWSDPAFVDPATLTPKHGEAHRTTLLSPFDSLVWERGRTERLFGFAFSLEAYKPKEQRVHGYFTMPLLAGGRIVGRVDPGRDGRTLVARTLTLEGVSAVDAMASALREAATWVGCDEVRIERTTPTSLRRALQRALS